ncbi:MAG: DHA2 family efflux MFS transporter permease subunit [bacterium]|nr:DHA2 family efflux MFS transporter permease subunit [bacterium]
MAQSQATTTEEWKPKYGPWLGAIPTIFAAFMFVLDETVANVALPHMAGTFSISRDESMWILTFYLVASGVIIPMVDWFCKIMGRKAFFMFSLALFTISSVVCGLSSSFGMMICARIFQGIGGGGLLPIAQAILLENFPPRERGKAMAVFGLVIVVAPIIGPVIGGWITENWSWPWIFFINLPIGILALFVSQKFIEDPPYAKKQKDIEFDAVGFSFLALWMITMQIVLDKGNNNDWFNCAWILQLTIVSALSFLAFIVSQMIIKKPLVDLSIFADKNYAICTTIRFMISAILLASLAILPQFLQSLLGYDAFKSGLTLMPRGLAGIVTMALLSKLSTRVDGRILTGFGLLVIGIAGLILGNLNLEISAMNVVIPNLVFGFGMGFAMVPLISLSVVTLKNSQMTNASGVQSMLANVGGAIGTSVCATLISRYSQMHQNMMVGNLSPLNPVFQTKLTAMKSAFMQYTSSGVATHMAQYSLYGELVKQSTLWGFIETFRIVGVAAIVLIPFLIFIKKIDLKKHD